MSERKTVSVECFFVVDEEGDYAVGIDADSAREAFENVIGELSNREQVRTIRVVVEVLLPITTTLKGTAPTEGESSRLTSIE
jgi:hypothetical protein